MEAFSKKDIRNLLSDLQLYSGNIKEVTDVYGPTPHGDHCIGGKIHTSMDTFNFMVVPHFCDTEVWRIQLADPVESLRRGHRSIVFFEVPKIHKDQELVKRYKIVNILYGSYNERSNMNESLRHPDYEAFLGYDHLPSYSAVLNAIIKQYRSVREKRLEQENREISRN